jgi:flagellar capping protein FliD
MAGAHDTVDAQLLEVRGQVDGLATDIRTMHERLDSTVTSTTERFNQLDLAQTTLAPHSTPSWHALMR